MPPLPAFTTLKAVSPVAVEAVAVETSREDGRYTPAEPARAVIVSVADAPPASVPTVQVLVAES